MQELVLVIYLNFLCECRGFYNLQDPGTNNELGGVLESYLKPISKLSELFPNQKVEVQLEIDGSNYRAPKKYLRQSLCRNESSGDETSSLVPNAPATIKSIYSSKLTTSEPNDRPVYLSDLRKILDEYEKRHSALHHKDIMRPPTLVTKRNVGALSEILKLLKKGVHVEKDVRRPTEENMSWFQIKIPRT